MPRFDGFAPRSRALGLKPVASIPISAVMATASRGARASIAWHEGPTVLEALDSFAPAQDVDELALRLPVQAVYRMD